ncbi:hypothetical protein DSO57_1009659 [Entomophthora muscae]|uniref:Uncharacterized protein n=1 Tax=Entomophthora muscae TaxID=34485 RepID=A0ACC2SVK3_9FUNG|nr:hypothetical protein DSO57_1009659 [Entomophthora muscae]
MKVSIWISCLSSTFAVYSDTDRCGSVHKGMMCNPQGPYGPCCSQSGYCGKTPEYCAIEKGCQSGCTASPPGMPASKCGDGFCDNRNETCYSCPRDCGKCNLQMLESCKDPGQTTLTFDLNPDQFTSSFLSDIKKLNITPTHFVVGARLKNVTYQNYLKQYHGAGHMIASNTFSHPHIKRLSDDQLRTEMIKADDAIFNTIGVRPIYMRIPYADADLRTLALLQSMGYQTIFTALRSINNILHPAQINSTILGAKNSTNTTKEYFNIAKIAAEIQSHNLKVVDINQCFGIQGAYRSEKCGDGKCSGYLESCQTCPQDCGKCPQV